MGIESRVKAARRALRVGVEVAGLTARQARRAQRLLDVEAPYKQKKWIPLRNAKGDHVPFNHAIKRRWLASERQKDRQAAKKAKKGGR